MVTYNSIIEKLQRYDFVTEPTGKPKSSVIFPDFYLSQKVRSHFHLKKKKCPPVGHTESTFYRGEKKNPNPEKIRIHLE